MAAALIGIARAAKEVVRIFWGLGAGRGHVCVLESPNTTPLRPGGKDFVKCFTLTNVVVADAN